MTWRTPRRTLAAGPDLAFHPSPRARVHGPLSAGLWTMSSMPSLASTALSVTSAIAQATHRGWGQEASREGSGEGKPIGDRG